MNDTHTSLITFRDNYVLIMLRKYNSPFQFHGHENHF